MNYNKEERKRYILNEIIKKNRITVKKIAKKLEVSMETIRQDLTILDDEKKLKKIHGGAVCFKEAGLEVYYSKRKQHNRKIKSKISKKASEMIEDGDIIGIGTGTTVFHILEYIQNRKNLTIITSSIPIVNELLEYKKNNKFVGEVYFIGGKINSNLLSAAGNLAEKMLNNIYMDKFFFSCDCFNEDGLFTYNANEGFLANSYLKHTAKVILVVDSSKINQTNFIKVCKLTRIDTIVTNIKASKKYEKIIKNNGLEWISIDKNKEIL